MGKEHRTYAPLPGPAGAPVATPRALPPKALQHRRATASPSGYREGNTEIERFVAAATAEIPIGSKSDNNTLIIAMSATTAGLLLIIVVMLFLVPRRS